MTPEERELLIDVAKALRALVAEGATGITIQRRDWIKQIDARLAALGIVDDKKEAQP